MTNYVTAEITESAAYVTYYISRKSNILQVPLAYFLLNIFLFSGILFTIIKTFRIWSLLVQLS